MGAGVIPLTVKDGKVQFLFQRTFTGRKVGYLIDFGGGLGDKEDYRSTAVREFVEETETMYLADNIKIASRSDDRVKQQTGAVDEIFERTLSVHPDWWCQRKPGDSKKHRKDWRTYFIEFPYRDITALNSEWESDTSGRFKKRRELVWILADSLLDIYDNSPVDLWKRVRQLENAKTLIHQIQSCLLQS